MKQVRVILFGTTKDTYERIVREHDPREEPLLRSITQKLSFLKQDPFHGDNIKKVLIPSALDATKMLTRKPRA